MRERTVTVTRTSIKVDTLDEAMELLAWGLEQPDIYVTLSAQCNGKLFIEVGGKDGINVKTGYLTDEFIWNETDGTFEVIKHSPEEAQPQFRPGPGSRGKRRVLPGGPEVTDG